MAVLVDGRTFALTHRSISIVADGRLEVCDAAHRIFVMKKGRGQIAAGGEKSQAVGGRGIPPFRKRRVEPPASL